jgi:hypothetical protein
MGKYGYAIDDGFHGIIYHFHSFNMIELAIRGYGNDVIEYMVILYGSYMNNIARFTYALNG